MPELVIWVTPPKCFQIALSCDRHLGLDAHHSSTILFMRVESSADDGMIRLDDLLAALRLTTNQSIGEDARVAYSRTERRQRDCLQQRRLAKPVIAKEQIDILQLGFGNAEVLEILSRMNEGN